MPNKLELTWHEKDEPFHIEPHLLIKNVPMTNTTADTDPENILIYGNIFLDLKEMKKKYFCRRALLGGELCF